MNKRFASMMLAIALLLLLPLVAMYFTNEVKWTLFDFAIAGSLLTATALLCEWILQKVRRRKHRLMLVAVVLLCLLLVWAELAVGIFGSPLAGSEEVLP